MACLHTSEVTWFNAIISFNDNLIIALISSNTEADSPAL